MSNQEPNLTTTEGVLGWVHLEATGTRPIPEPEGGDPAWTAYRNTAATLARAMRIAAKFERFDVNELAYALHNDRSTTFAMGFNAGVSAALEHIEIMLETADADNRCGLKGASNESFANHSSDPEAGPLDLAQGCGRTLQEHGK